MKKILLAIFLLIFSNNVLAFEKKTNFTLDQFKKAQNDGNIIIVNSWNKFCSTCKAQSKVFASAQRDFQNVLFFFYEHTKHPEISEYLKIDYWTTIVVYKKNEEIAREMGLTDRKKIYELIKKGI